MNDWFPADDADRLVLFRNDVLGLTAHAGWKIFVARLRSAQADVIDQLGKVPDPVMLAKLAGQAAMLKSLENFPEAYSQMVNAQLAQLKKEKDNGQRNRGAGPGGGPLSHGW